MDKSFYIERAKMYLEMLGNGVHPVTGNEIPQEAGLSDERVKNCFIFITKILDEYSKMAEKVATLEAQKEEKTIIIQKKQEFAVTREQLMGVSLSREPITLMTFMKNVNAVIDASSMEKLSSTKVTKWLVGKGLITQAKVQAVVNKTVYKPSEAAQKIGIVEAQVVDEKSGEMKSQVKLGESAQMWLLENIEEIAKKK